MYFRMSRLSVNQRELLRIARDDVYMAFIYQIGILMEDLPPKPNDGQ